MDFPLYDLCRNIGEILNDLADAEAFESTVDQDRVIFEDRRSPSADFVEGFPVCEFRIIHPFDVWECHRLASFRLRLPARSSFEMEARSDSDRSTPRGSPGMVLHEGAYPLRPRVLLG